MRPTNAPAAVAPLTADPDFTLSNGQIMGRLPPLLPGQDGSAAAQVALLVDGLQVGGAAVSTMPDGTRSFAMPLPAHVVGRTLDVVAAGTGASLLPEPVDYLAAQGLRWIEWSAGNAQIDGSFTFDGPAAPPSPLGTATPIQVHLSMNGSPYATLYAVQDAGGDGIYRFHHAMHALMPAGASLEFTGRVGSIATPTPLTMTPQQCGYIAYVDPTDAPWVTGWAVDLGNPSRRVKLDLIVRGEVVATGVANNLREDVMKLGFGDGRSGFTIPFPNDLRRDTAFDVAVTIAGTSLQLVNSPYAVPALPPVMGYFDALEGPFAGGWAVNMHFPDQPLQVECVCEGEVIGSGLADLFRGDVEKAGLPTARCGFRFLLERPLAELFDKDIFLRVVGTDIDLGGSPRQISQNKNIARFLDRTAGIPPSTLHRLIRQMTYRTSDIGISIVMPVYNTRREWLIEALNSVLGQWSANWELICVDDGSPLPHVRQILEAAARHDPRIRVISSGGNLGIAGATNLGLRDVRGTHVAFMDHDDVIEPDAVYKLAVAAKETGADLIYSDEAITTDDVGSIIEVRARPAFSHDYYLSHPYFVHMICVRTSLAQQLGGWDESLAISADVDFVLRAIEGSAKVAHVPSVLYRWRTHTTSAGHTKQSEVNDATKAALTRHLVRLGRDATVSDGFRYNEYRVNWKDDDGEILIVIPTKNRVDLLKVCIDSIEATSKGENYRIVVIDHQSDDKKTVRYLKEISARHTIMPYSGIFNYALMNNLAVKTHGGESKHVLFLNNDVEAREDGWLARMRSLSARPEVGAVGPLLLYGDDRIQHAGVLMAFSGAADHAMKFQEAYLSKGKRHPGYNCSLTTVRDYSAVTAACLMIRMEVFRQVRGFDEGFVIGFNDTDLCLRIGAAGYKVLYDGFTVLYHHESATRTTSNEVDHPEDDARLRTRWKRYFTHGDPFYSPILAPKGTDHTLRQDPGCKGRMQARVVLISSSNASATVAEVRAPIIAKVPRKLLKRLPGLKTVPA